jgi:WD40 repeat protein
MNPASPERSPNSGVDAQNPWPGLVAYTEESRDFFHGRAEETEELLRRVARKNLTVFFGQSGLGKSSLLQAGLFPQLRAEGSLPIPIRLDHAASAPPLSEQVNAAATAAILEADGRWEETAPGANESLWEHFHRRSLRLQTADGLPICPVLVFDQFEELFAIGQTSEVTRSRSATFLTDLADFVENRAPSALEDRLENNAAMLEQFIFDARDFRVLLSLREDYLPHLESLRQAMPSITENRMRLTRMNGTRALEAVANPGRNLITPAVAAQVVHFVAGGRMRAAKSAGNRREDDGLANLEVEPSLLSLVCRELNNRRTAMGLAHISADLVAGNRERILQDFYDGCFAGQPPAVRAFVEDELVTDSGLRENIAVERATKALARRGAPASAIDDLVRCRLLHLEDRLDIQRVELTHDVLTPVVKKSRDERENREAMLRAKQQAQETLEKSRNQRRRLRLVVAGMTGALIAVSGLGVWVFSLYDNATKARKEALDEKERAEVSRKEAKQELADGLILHGDALRQARRCNDARDSLIRSHAVLKELGLSPLRPNLVLWNLYYDSPPELMTYSGHSAIINCVAFSPDGRSALSGSADKTLKLWDLVRGVEKSTLSAHTLDVRSVCFSRDGHRALSGGDDNTVRLWDIDSGEAKVMGIPGGGHKLAVTSVCFSPDGHRALSGSDDQTVRVWDIDSGNEVIALSGHTAGVTSVAFSVDGRAALSGSADATLKLWDVRSGNVSQTMSGHSGAVTNIAFCTDGHSAFSGSVDNTLRQWDLVSGKEIKTISGQSIGIKSVAFSPDGRRALSTGAFTLSAYAGADATLTLWDLESGKVVGTFSAYTNDVAGVALSPDGRTALAGGADRTLELLDLGDGEEVRTFVGHSRSVTTVAISPGDLIALSGSLDHKLKLWDLETGKALRTMSGHRKGVYSVAFSPDGHTALSGSWDSTMRLWGIADGKEIMPPFPAAVADDLVAGVAFSPDGRTAFSCCEDRTLTLWDLASGRNTRALAKPSELSGPSGQSSGWRGLAISCDGRTVLACSTDGTMKMWDLASDKDPTTFSGHNGPVNCVAISVDSRRALSGSGDHSVRLWDTDSGIQRKMLSGHDEAVNSVAFSPDDRTALSGGDDHVLKMWDLLSEKELGTFTGHTSAVKSVAFAHDGGAVLSGSSDNTMKLWRIGRIDRYIEFSDDLAKAHTELSLSPADPKSLAVLGGWYAFRGVDAWAVELLEQARSGGATVSPLTLARCYWKRGSLGKARKELYRALQQKEKPVDYLNLCIATIDADIELEWCLAPGTF